MENNTKSKITVIGFVLFVLAIYSASYFYTKSNNQRLLSSPRLVMLVGSEEIVNSELAGQNAELRRSTMRTLFNLGRVFSISQMEYDGGTEDIAKIYSESLNGQQYKVVDCLAYSETLKRTMEKVAKTNMRATWVFSVCGIIE